MKTVICIEERTEVSHTCTYVLWLVKARCRLVHHGFDLVIFRRIHGHKIERLQENNYEPPSYTKRQAARLATSLSITKF